MKCISTHFSGSFRHGRACEGFFTGLRAVGVWPRAGDRKSGNKRFPVLSGVT